MIAKKKIVFILNAVSIPRCIKRVEEFVNRGFDVDVYGFDRGGESYIKSDLFDVKIIGKHDIGQSYPIRFRIIMQSLKSLFKKYEKKDVLFYYFFFDVAFCATILSKRPYIYEESDLPYTNINNITIRRFLSGQDKRIIKKSLLTVMTSEGFVDYHFGSKKPNNIIVIPNRINPKLMGIPFKNKITNIEHLSFAFVGGFRYQSVLNFTLVIAEKFPQHDFHAFGNIMQNQEICEQLMATYPNVHFHGKFKNPEDLPSIYEQIDLVIAAYDATSINAQYAEPNKLYEAIYFNTPIIVSSGTFLANKVKRLRIGYDVNALEKKEIERFINELTYEDLITKKEACKRIPNDYVINNNPKLFMFLATYLV